ncbi:Os07g0275201, partial [Oryza sativa Japonica Group]
FSFADFFPLLFLLLLQLSEARCGDLGIPNNGSHQFRVRARFH